MGRKFSRGICCAGGMFLFHHAKNLPEVRLLAGIGSNTFISRFPDQVMRDILTGVQYACTAVIGLFLVLRAAEDPVDQRNHGITVYGGPASVISPIVRIAFFVI